jgi:hypothetical protein
MWIVIAIAIPVLILLSLVGRRAIPVTDDLPIPAAVEIQEN